MNQDGEGWTSKWVWAEVVSAAHTSTSLSCGPEPIASLGTTEPADIARVRRVQGWMSLLTPDDRDLLWARAKNQRWKQICWQHGISRPTAHRRRDRALARITAHLRESDAQGIGVIGERGAVGETFLNSAVLPDARIRELL